MRIGIDARFFGPIGKGLGRYTQKLVEKLEKLDLVNEYLVFLKKENFDEYQPQNPNFKKVLADYKWYSISEQLSMPRLLRKYKLDLVHFPHFNVPFLYKEKFVVTIHDLILIHFPTIKNTTLNPLYYWIKFIAYRLIINFAIGRSEKIIAVSEFTKKDIVENYENIPLEKIIVTHEACEDFCMLSPNKDVEILKRYAIIKPYLIYVGNAYPHKNLEKLVGAFSSLHEKHPDLSLVLVGKEDYFYRRLKDVVAKKGIDRVVFVGYVPDYDLDTLFHNAKAFVFPSLYEGFGLPPLEAMAKGLPVICSDHPCMREILGESAYYFNGKIEAAIAKAIDLVLLNNDLQNKIREAGYRQIKKYSWKKMAEETMGVYKSVKL